MKECSHFNPGDEIYLSFFECLKCAIADWKPNRISPSLLNPQSQISNPKSKDPSQQQCQHAGYQQGCQHGFGNASRQCCQKIGSGTANG